MNGPWNTLAASITRLGDRVDAMPTVREATLASLTPLAVRFDTDTTDTLVQGTLAGSLSTGQRVMTLRLRHYVWIMGVKGGDYLPGELKLYAGEVAPAGWILSRGQSLLRREYPQLYAAIGTAYGAGDNTEGPNTTFKLPDLRGRVAVGKDPDAAEFNTLGKYGGAKTHTLSAEELPRYINLIASNTTSGRTDSTDNGGTSVVAGNTTGRFRRNVGNELGGNAHNNLQPYTTLNYIIKL